MIDKRTDSEIYNAGWEMGRTQGIREAAARRRDYDALRAEVEHLRTTLGYLADNIDNPALVAVAEAALKPKP